MSLSLCNASVSVSVPLHFPFSVSFCVSVLFIISVCYARFPLSVSLCVVYVSVGIALSDSLCLCVCLHFSCVSLRALSPAPAPAPRSGGPSTRPQRSWWTTSSPTRSMPSAWRHAPHRAWAPSPRWCGSARCSPVGVSRTPPSSSGGTSADADGLCALTQEEPAVGGGGRLWLVPSWLLDLRHARGRCLAFPTRAMGPPGSGTSFVVLPLVWEELLTAPLSLPLPDVGLIRGVHVAVTACTPGGPSPNTGSS